MYEGSDEKTRIYCSNIINKLWITEQSKIYKNEERHRKYNSAVTNTRWFAGKIIKLRKNQSCSKDSHYL